MQLKGKVALVTGGAGGVGSAVSRRLGTAGATVIVADIDLERGAEALANDITQAGGRAHLMQLDQRSLDSIDRCVDAIAKQHGRLDILVNNAAWNVKIPFRDLDALTIEVWDRISETNLRGPFLLSRACAALLRANGGGCIVNISSAGGIAPFGSSIAYSANKAGLNHLTRCLAIALAPEVTVNCIAPGLVANTGMSNRASDPGSQEAAGRQTLLGHATEPNDIAEQVLAFVASASTTGQIIAIDAGLVDGRINSER